MAISKIILNGVTQMDLTQDTVAAANLISPNTAHDAAGLPVTGTATAGIDLPIFSTVYDSDNDYQLVSITCNKTYSELYALEEDGLLAGALEHATVTGSDSYEYEITLTNIGSVGYPSESTFPPPGDYLNFVSSGRQPYYDIYLKSNDEIYLVKPSVFAGTLNVTANGTYEPEYGDYSYVKVNVNVPTGTARTSADLTVSGATVTAPAGLYSEAASASVASGTEGTPTATKDTVSNNSVTVTPSVTNVAGYISGGTHSGTAVTVTASELVSGSETKTANGTYDVANLEEIVVNVPTGTARTSSDLTVSGATVTVPAGLYSSQASASVASGTAGTPTASKGTVSNHSIAVTPSVTNTTGYITGGTKNGTAVTVSASELVSGTYTVDSSGTKDVTNYASASVPAGTAGTPSATKGTVSNHQVSVTPSVTNTTGWITGGTKSGTAVTVTASELASGNKAITDNGTNIDVVGYSTVSVAVPFSTIYSGSGNPSSSTGSNGDIYIKTS